MARKRNNNTKTETNNSTTTLESKLISEEKQTQQETQLSINDPIVTESLVPHQNIEQCDEPKKLHPIGTFKNEKNIDILICYSEESDQLVKYS